VNSDLPDAERPVQAGDELPARPEPPRDRSVPVLRPEAGLGKAGRAGPRDGAASTEEVSRVPVRADLRVGTASLDWESLDRDMRQFLSRLVSQRDAPDDRWGEAAWPSWIAVLAALLVARKAAGGQGWWSRRIAPRAVPAGTAPARSPDPPGPWPLGLL
jgi:hypothetical protein